MIEVKKLSKKFNDLTAVDNISFNVAQGEIFAFLGPNGAGKTTTIKMLTTLLKPTSGEIRLDGKNPQHERDGVRRSFGIVFQDPSLDEELTARENMLFHAALYGIGKRERTERVEEMLRFMELEERADDLAKKFSGGMKRRLEIARGLLHRPKVLFLDEPTLGLDPQTRNTIWQYVQELNRTEGTTVFLTTHYMEEAERVADRIGIIDHGRIIALGTAEELKTKHGGNTLEETFLNLTGKKIRPEEWTEQDNFRAHVRARRQR